VCVCVLFFVFFVSCSHSDALSPPTGPTCRTCACACAFYFFIFLSCSHSDTLSPPAGPTCRIYVSMYVCVCMCVHVCACMHVCVCVCVCVHTHTHTHTHRLNRFIPVYPFPFFLHFQIAHSVFKPSHACAKQCSGCESLLLFRSLRPHKF